MTKSELFTQYNRARAAARKGLLDPKAVNKALGVAQSKTPRPYITTTKSCTCPAFAHGHGKACKHIVAKMIEYRASQATSQPVLPEPQLESPLQFSCGDWLTAEQMTGSYRIHIFPYKSDFESFSKSHTNLRFVRPTQASGRRSRPDTVHEIVA